MRGLEFHWARTLRDPSFLAVSKHQLKKKFEHEENKSIARQIVLKNLVILKVRFNKHHGPSKIFGKSMIKAGGDTCNVLQTGFGWQRVSSSKTADTKA